MILNRFTYPVKKALDLTEKPEICSRAFGNLPLSGKWLEPLEWRQVAKPPVPAAVSLP